MLGSFLAKAANRAGWAYAAGQFDYSELSAILFYTKEDASCHNEPVTVYECETGDPAVMHSIDALEAVRLGHYAYAAPEGKEADPEALRPGACTLYGRRP